MFDDMRQALQDRLGGLSLPADPDQRDVDGALDALRVACAACGFQKEYVRKLISQFLHAVMSGLRPDSGPLELAAESAFRVIAPVERRFRWSLTGGPDVVLVTGLPTCGQSTAIEGLARICRGRGSGPAVLAEEPGEDLRPRIREAAQKGADPVIIDAVGIPDSTSRLPERLTTLVREIEPQEILVVCDSRTGADACRFVNRCNLELSATGVILTRMDRDPTGVAAASMFVTTGTPVRFACVGRGEDGFEVFSRRRTAATLVGVPEEAIPALYHSGVSGTDDDAGLFSAIHSMNDYLSGFEQILKVARAFGDGPPPFPGAKPRPPRMEPHRVERRRDTALAMLPVMAEEERLRPERLSRRDGERIVAEAELSLRDVWEVVQDIRENRLIFAGLGHWQFEEA